jgi:hypothetical protein
MVEADSNDADEKSAGDTLWGKLDTKGSASEAEFMAQALTRLLADTSDDKVNFEGKWNSCES